MHIGTKEATERFGIFFLFPFELGSGGPRYLEVSRSYGNARKI
jgi:hypothetical protein